MGDRTLKRHNAHSFQFVSIAFAIIDASRVVYHMRVMCTHARART